MNTEAFAIDRETSFDRCAAKTGTWLQDFPSHNSFADYLRLIDELADASRYRVMPGKGFYNAPADPERITVFLRHDIDNDPFTALRMAHAEAERGLHGTYYVLPTGVYYGIFRNGKYYRYVCMDWIYQAIASLGHEIGVHNDLLTLMLEYDIDPASFQTQELRYYKEIGITVRGVCSHGSRFNALGLNNTWMYSEFGRKGNFVYGGKTYGYGELTLTQFGFLYEPYLFARDMRKEHRLSDIGPDRGSKLPSCLKAFEPGIKIMLLTHPIHWKDQNPKNGNES